MNYFFYWLRLSRLIQWRDRVGYIVNESPTFVCPTSLLLMIAATVPTNSDQLQILYSPLPRYVQPSLPTQIKDVENILDVISQSLKEFEILSPQQTTPAPEPPVQAVSVDPPSPQTLEEVEALPTDPPSPQVISDSFETKQSQANEDTLQPTLNHESLRNANNSKIPIFNVSEMIWIQPSWSLWKIVGIMIAIGTFGFSLYIPRPSFRLFSFFVPIRFTT